MYTRVLASLFIFRSTRLHRVDSKTVHGLFLVLIQQSTHNGGGVIVSTYRCDTLLSQFAAERSTVVVGSCRPCQRSTHRKHVYKKGEFSHIREFFNITVDYLTKLVSMSVRPQKVF